MKNKEISIGMALWMSINFVIGVIAGLLVIIHPENAELHAFLLGVFLTTLFGLPILLSYLQSKLDEQKEND